MHFWTDFNPFYSRFSRNYTRHVQLQEKMDIFCPQYESPADEDSRTFSKSHHFQIIYMVDEASFNMCHLNEAKAKKVRLRVNLINSTDALCLLSS